MLLALKPFCVEASVFPVRWHTWADENNTTRHSWASHCRLEPGAARPPSITPGRWTCVLFVICISPLGEEALPPCACFSRHLFRLSFFSPTPSSSSLTSPLKAGSVVCAMPPHCWQGEGEKKSLFFVLQIQRVIIPSFPMDECVKIIVGS